MADAPDARREMAACCRARHCGCHGFWAPGDAAIERHESEHMRRIAWCIRHGHVPAHSHVHLAPGDDREFVYGVPPWKPDGSPNPVGIYFGVVSSAAKVERAEMLLQKEAEHAGWTCTSCAEWVPGLQRPCPHPREPHDWWWCATCKATKAKPTARARVIQDEAAKLHKIGDMFARHAPSGEAGAGASVA